MNGTQRGRWWHNPWNVGSLAVSLLFAGLALGFLLGEANERLDPPAEDSADVGFLRDMAIHHDQAIRMAFIYINKPIDETNPLVRTIATEIIRNQQYEVGIMVQALAHWGYEAQNPDEVVMRWMGMAIPEEQMPGMATEAQIDELKAADGIDATRLFAQLMVAHHEAGISMADYAADAVDTGTARNLAENFAKAQRGEIIELNDVIGGL